MKRSDNTTDKTKAQTATNKKDMVHIHITRRNFWLLAIALGLPYVLALGLTIWKTDLAFGRKAKAATTSADPLGSSYIPLAPGPWGELEYVPMNIEIPEELLSVRADEKIDRRWFFGGASPEQLTQFLNAAGLNDGQRKELLDRSRWQIATNGIYVTPSRDSVFTLSPQSRQKIYSVLSIYPENIGHQEAFTFVAAEFDNFFKDTDVAPVTIALVKKLSYPHGKLLRFADLSWVLETLPSYQEKLRLEKAVSRRSTLFVKMRITPQTDVNAIMNYWGRAGTSKNLKPLIESLVKVPGGLRINVSFLMPDLAAARLYTYPFPSLNQPENCHWTSFNFFKDHPEINFADSRIVKQKLDEEYFPVFSDPRYGDLVFLVRQNGDIVHSCVFVADNVVYTKNGGHFTAPWMLATIPGLVETYSAWIPANEKLVVAYYRNKYF
jgi:hypothetical protein